MAVVSFVSFVSTSTSFSSSIASQDLNPHDQDSRSSPVHFPPFLAGMMTFLFLVLEADSPQVAEQGPQADHSDQRQSVGKSCTAMED